MRVLIVDDYDLVREMVVVFLFVEGVFEVKIVVLLDEVLCIIDESGSFDVVLFDYNMLGMNGLDGLVCMWQVNDNCFVVILLGIVMCDVVDVVFKVGVVGFVLKIFVFKLMVMVICFMVVGEIYVLFGFM